MSDRSLAKHVQNHTDHTYQSALHVVRELKPKAKELAENHGWSLRDAIHLLVVERWMVQRRGRYVRECTCDNCYVPFFVALDKKGLAEYDGELCAECRVHKCGEGADVPCAACKEEFGHY